MSSSSDCCCIADWCDHLQPWQIHGCKERGVLSWRIKFSFQVHFSVLESLRWLCSALKWTRRFRRRGARTWEVAKQKLHAGKQPVLTRSTSLLLWDMFFKLHIYKRFAHQHAKRSLCHFTNANTRERETISDERLLSCSIKKGEMWMQSSIWRINAFSGLVDVENNFTMASHLHWCAIWLVKNIHRAGKHGNVEAAISSVIDIQCSVPKL